MRMALRLVTALLAVSLMGSLSVCGEWCESVSAPCHNTEQQRMNCCQSMPCHCCLSAPVQSVPNSTPTRAASVAGHDVAKVVSFSLDVTSLASREHSVCRLTALSGTAQSLPAGSYLLTHAFLI